MSGLVYVFSCLVFAFLCWVAIPKIYEAYQRPRPYLINYEPRGDRVIVSRLPPPEPVPGEVILPASQQKPLNEAIVISVGPGLRNRVTGKLDSIDLAPGDRICFVDYAGFDVEVDGKKYLSLRDEEIHGRRL